MAVERGISAEQQLLTCLTLGIESTRNLSATERTVGKQAAVFTGERYALGNTLVDDIVRHFGQTIYVGFTGAVVATLNGVVEQAINRVAVVLIVLGSVDTTLSSDRVSTARRILDAEVEHVESHFSQSRSSRSTGETGTYNDDVELTLVGRIHQFLMSLVVGPFFCNRTFRYLRIDFLCFFHFYKNLFGYNIRRRN